MIATFTLWDRDEQKRYMEVHPRPIAIRHGRPILRQQEHPPPIQFGGVVDAVTNTLSKGIGYIDSRPTLNLATTDVGGMGVPRAGLEWKKRGVDAGIETIIRELTGLFVNMFASILFCRFALNAFGQRVNLSNPQGINQGAWINLPNLEAFSKIYQDALDNSKSLKEARQVFIKKVLEGMESQDRQLSLTAQQNFLMPKAGEPIETLQAQWKTFQAFLAEHYTSQKHDVTKLPALFQSTAKMATDFEQLKQILESCSIKADSTWGRLDQEARKTFETFYEKHNPSAPIVNFKKTGISMVGTQDFSKAAHQKLREILEQKAQSSPELAQHGIKKPSDANFHQWKETLKKAQLFDYDKAFTKLRLQLSQDHLPATTRNFAKFVDKEALHANITSTVDLYHPHTDLNGQAVRPLVSAGQSRKDVLTQLKFFLEEVVDRAARDVKDRPRTSNQAWKQAMEQRLFGESSQSAWGKLLPQANDGLATTIRKSRRVFTGAPLATAILWGFALTFYNNYLTKARNNGKVFFPGEGVPVTDSTVTQSAHAPPKNGFNPSVNPLPSPHVTLAGGYSAFNNTSGLNPAAMMSGSWTTPFQAPAPMTEVVS